MQRIVSTEALEYFKKEKMDSFFEITSTYKFSPYDAIDPANTTPFPPDAEDLARLHQLIRQRRVLTILEFGVGFSTVVMADALAKNKKEYEAEFLAGEIRCLHPFKVFSVDASKKWIEETEKKFPAPLKPFASFTHSRVIIGSFNGRICHYYEKLPDICPDFIYLDGPAGHQVEGQIGGSSFVHNMERTVISGDLLRLEPTLTPGTLILIDGRMNNVIFLKNNFQRNWKVVGDFQKDYTIFELTETSLGIHNKNRLKFHNIAYNNI